MLRWTSSKSRDHANSPRAISAPICERPRSMSARSRAAMIPVAASIRAWASDPAMSASANRRSKSTDAVKRLTRSSTGSLNRPDHPPASSEAGGGGVLAADMAQKSNVLRRPHTMPTMNAGDLQRPYTRLLRDSAVRIRYGTRRRAQCLHAASNMAAIIRQNPNRPALPDFRNLGTVLRILVAVNLGAAVVAFARAPHLSAVLPGWVEATAVVEPYLLLVLAVLWALSPWLSRLPFGVGAGGHRRRDGPGRSVAIRRAGPRCCPCRGHAGALDPVRPARGRHHAVLFPSARPRAVAGHHRGAVAGAAGAHPPPFPVQQHQRRCCRWCGPTPGAPKSPWRTWPTCSAC